MGFFSFQRASIKQKISSLFVVLLSFLICVILFSVYKLNELKNDMREVAYLDIPLSQIVTQIEFIEMEQHLQLEEYQLQQKQAIKDLKPHQQLVFQKRKLKTLQDRAVTMLENNLHNHRVLLDPTDHQKVLAQVERYRTESGRFEQHLQQIYSKPSVTDTELSQTEELAGRLENEEKVLLKLISQMASTDADYTERHEEDFFFINSILGLCALILGLLLTVYIIQIIMRRVNNIQRQIKAFDANLDVADNHASPLRNTRDELEELEHDVGVLMSKLNQEIESREQVEKKLIQLATRDKLTGLYNRHKWDEQIAAHISLAQRDYPFGLILLDIDFFKKINDKYGHLTGDNLLKLLASILQREVREIDQIFRLGGEEFAIICPMKDASLTTLVAEKVRLAVEHTQEPNMPSFTLSLGVSTYHIDDDMDALFKRADKALYQAKAQGRNQVVTEAQLS